MEWRIIVCVFGERGIPTDERSTLREGHTYNIQRRILFLEKKSLLDQVGTGKFILDQVLGN